MGETGPGGPIKEIPPEHRGAHPVNTGSSEMPLTFGNVKNIQPLRRRPSTQRPEDAIPEELGLDINPGEIIELQHSGPSPTEIRKLEKTGEIPKIRTLPRGRLILSTPDIDNQDLRMVTSKKISKVKLTSKWGRDPKSGLLYVRAQFDQYYRDGKVATEEQRAQDRAHFMKENFDFFHPENSRANNEGVFFLGMRPGSGWISSIFD